MKGRSKNLQSRNPHQNVYTTYVTTTGLMKMTTVVTPGCTDTTKTGSMYAKCQMLVNGKQLTFQIDTGATVNMLPAGYARDVVPYNGILTIWMMGEPKC